MRIAIAALFLIVVATVDLPRCIKPPMRLAHEPSACYGM